MKREWWHYVPHVLLALLVLWVLSRLSLVLAPFAIAYVFAGLLDPLVVRLEKRGWKRGAAVAYIYGVLLLLLVIALFTVLPIAVIEVRQFTLALPQYVDSAKKWYQSWTTQGQKPLSRIGGSDYLVQLAGQHAGDVGTMLAKRLAAWAQTAFDSVGFLLWLVLIPLATLYMLSDLPHIRARFLAMIPPRHRETARLIAHDAAAVFMGYLRGLSIVSALYGLGVLVVLAAMGVPYALVLGLMAGVLYPVPYLGPLITAATIVLVTGVTRSWGMGTAAGVAAVALQTAFDYGLTPRIVGKSIGLHPLINMIALLVGANLFGIVGMLIAVPTAGAIQIILLHLVPSLGDEPPEPEQDQALEPLL